MKIYTAHYRYAGPGRLDITVKGQDPVGKILAPTWDMVMGLKKGRMTVHAYTDAYSSLFMNAVQNSYSILLDLSKQETLTFVCFCRPGEFCHRVLCARNFETIGLGTYVGEIEPNLY